MAKGHSVSTSSLLLECQPPPPPPPLPEQFFAEKMEQEDEDKNIYVNVNQIDEPVQSAGVVAEDDSESTYYITPTVQPTISQPVQDENSTKKKDDSSVTVEMQEMPATTVTSNSTAEDAELKFAQAIIEADLEAVNQGLKNNQLKSLDISKIPNDTVDKAFGETIHPLDLAAEFGQVPIIDHILKYAFESLPKFDVDLKNQDFFHASLIFQRLLIISPKTAEELLNQKVTSNHYASDEGQKTSEETHLAFDFSLFRTRNLYQAESLPVELMLKEGHRDLIKQPLTEAFVYLKWEKLSWAFYVAFVYRVLLALLVTFTAFAEVSPHPFFSALSFLTRSYPYVLVYAMLAFYLPALLQLLFEGLQRRPSSDFIFSTWVQLLPKPCPPLPLPSVSFSVQLGLLSSLSVFVALILTQNENHTAALTHSAAWTVLLVWVFVFLKMSDCPLLGVYVYILRTVLRDVLAFLISTLALILGFAFSFHLIVQGNDYASPHAAFTALLAFIVGDYGQRDVVGVSKAPGTAEILFVIAYLLLSIGVMNVLIGLCVANIKDILMQKEDFKLASMILNNLEIEETMLISAQFFQKLKCCCFQWVKMATLLYGDDETVNCKYFMLPYQNTEDVNAKRRRRSKAAVLPLRFGNAISVSNMALFQETKECSQQDTGFTLPGWIWENARPIIEERLELERIQAEEEERKRKEAEDYTSLYWNGSSDGCKQSENEYEVVEENSRYFGGGLLRGIRESLLRELRRDLAKLARPVFYRGEDKNRRDQPKQDGKCVNLRPGLALGVITLQAGSRQKDTMH